MQYAKNTKMFYYIQLHFAICKPARFSGYSDPQSSAQRKTHIQHSVLREYKLHRESTNIWQLTGRMTEMAMTDESKYIRVNV